MTQQIAPVPAPAAPVPDRPRPSLAGGLVRSARPKQWIKNVLVFAAPGAAGVATEGEVLGRTALTFVLFCLAASGTYYLNDSLDYAADRQHPTKRHRPIAAGVVPLGLYTQAAKFPEAAITTLTWATGRVTFPAFARSEGSPEDRRELARRIGQLVHATVERRLPVAAADPFR